jgi:hypothetical protein
MLHIASGTVQLAGKVLIPTYTDYYFGQQALI